MTADLKQIINASISKSCPSRSVRHAEKRSRVSSCLLADRIAHAVISIYRRHCPRDLQQSYQQTVIAGILMHYVRDGISRLEVISVGIGTKTLSSHIIMKDLYESDEVIKKGSKRVRDCHAEILAKRGYQRFLFEESIRLISDPTYASSHPWFDTVEDSEGRLKYSLRMDVSVYLYSSSTPCGNATIKKWAKSNKPKEYSDLSEDEYPIELKTHEPLAITARDQGQVALLVKRDAVAVLARSEQELMTQLNYHSIDPNSLMETTSTKTIEVPKGMAIPGTGRGILMSCSDKITLWNVLGIQGSLLSIIFHPIYLDAIVIGRKYSKIHCQRALCCRLQDFHNPMRCFIGNKLKKKEWDNRMIPTELYEIHHPAMLSTGVIFDESIIEMNESENEDDKEDKYDMIPSGAKFREWRCFSWWYRLDLEQTTRHSIPNTKMDSTNDSNHGFISIIDSRTGYEVSTGGREEMDDGCCSATTTTTITDSSSHLSSSISPLSSYSFLNLYLQVQERLDSIRSSLSSSSIIIDREEETNGYLFYKRRQKEYTTTKDILLSDPRFFGDWIRKNTRHM